MHATELYVVLPIIFVILFRGMCVCRYKSSLQWPRVKVGEEVCQTCDSRNKVVQNVCQAARTSIDGPKFEILPSFTSLKILSSRQELSLLGTSFIASILLF